MISVQLQIIPWGMTKLLMNQAVRYVSQPTFITADWAA